MSSRNVMDFLDLVKSAREAAQAGAPTWWEPGDQHDLAEIQDEICQEMAREATMALPRLGHAVYCRKCGSDDLRRVHRSAKSQGCEVGCSEHFEHMLVLCLNCTADNGKERPMDCRGNR